MVEMLAATPARGNKRANSCIGNRQQADNRQSFLDYFRPTQADQATQYQA
jgi:hypothetical protein